MSKIMSSKSRKRQKTVARKKYLLKMQWFQGLQGGKYDQAVGALHKKQWGYPTHKPTDRYCCLGVLIDIEYKRDVFSWLRWDKALVPDACARWWCAEGKHQEYDGSGDNDAYPPMGALKALGMREYVSAKTATRLHNQYKDKEEKLFHNYALPGWEWKHIPEGMIPSALIIAKINDRTAINDLYRYSHVLKLLKDPALWENK